MDEVVTKIYRRLLQTGFEYSGSIDHPSIFLDTKLEGLSICGQAGRDYMNIYINVNHGVIEDIKYLCFCDPTANVVVETLCRLVKGRTIEEAKALAKEEFFRVIGSEDESLSKKVLGIIELLHRGINRFERGAS
jgi:NifU-like protein involved in Fe-S cluster formation